MRLDRPASPEAFDSSVSVGGPRALAAGAYLDPARLRHVAFIGGASYAAFGANWAAKHLGSADALGGGLALHFHAGFKLMYALIGMSATHFEASYATALRKAVNAADREVLADGRVMQLLLAASRECFRQGADEPCSTPRLSTTPGPST